MRLNTLILILLAVMAWPGALHAANSIPEDRSSAVIVAYHRIGEDIHTETSLKKDQFDAHVEELLSGNYNIMPVPDILEALENAAPLPENTIGITFEGAYNSAYENGMKTLMEKNIPFTVFYSSDNADNATGQYMDWDALKEIHRHANVTLGLLPASYTRLSGAAREEILAQINKAKLRFREVFSQEPLLFSYPFGEHSLDYKKIIREQGFKAAFGLHSGALWSGSDFMALPRFTMTGFYGDLDRFRLVSHALPLPASDMFPQDAYLANDTPLIGFSLPASLDRENLSCHVSGQPKPDIEFLGENRVELRLREKLNDERTRVNCTMPGPETGIEPPHWRWLGMLLILREPAAHQALTEGPEEISPPQDEPL